MEKEIEKIFEKYDWNKVLKKETYSREEVKEILLVMGTQFSKNLIEMLPKELEKLKG